MTFRTTFHTDDAGHRQYNGQPFHVLYPIDAWEFSDQAWLIQFEDGREIVAFAKEIVAEEVLA